jgi:LysM repeat protein
MRLRFVVVLLPALVALIAPGGASAASIHIVSPGESLYSIAAADGVSPSLADAVA